MFFLPLLLNIISCCLLASIVSDEKSAFNLIESLLYMMNHFSLAAFRILSFSSFQHFVYNLSVNFFCSSSYFEFFSFQGVQISVFHQLWEVFGHCFFRYSFSFLFHYAHFGIPDGVPPVSDTLFTSLFFFLFLSVNSLS